MSQPTLYLMLGYPGAGKTTTADIIAKLTGAVHLASDQIRLEMFTRPTFSAHEHRELYQAIDAQTETLLGQGKSVIYDANLNRYEHRQEKYQICRRANAKAVLVWIEVDVHTAKRRATHPERNHLVPPGEQPAAMFDRIVNILEPPRPNEPTIRIDGNHVTSTNVKLALGGL